MRESLGVSQVLATVPYNLPTEKMRKNAIRHWIRSGPLRSSYRRLVAACVAPLPFVPHSYPEPERQRRPQARLQTFEPAAVVAKLARQRSGSTDQQLQEPYAHASGRHESDLLER